MKYNFSSIIILLFLGLVFLNEGDIHRERLKKSKKRKSKPKASKKSTHKIRKKIKKGYKIQSDEPIDPKKLRLRFDLGD